MKISLALVSTVVFLPIIVNAQAASNSTNITVTVASGGSLVYNPSNFTAANGTSVTFVFANAPHSVTQSSFEDPCTYLAAANGSSGGFDSGLQTGKEFTITITNDQAPIWFFCKEANHCGSGMVGSINAPTSGNTADAFLAAALPSARVNQPGPVTGGVNAVATSTPTATSPSSGSSSSPSGSSSKPSGSSSSPSPSSSKSSDAGRLVASGIFALLATALGISLA
ncbi:Cupredoxin [Lactarius quietus]|nr:Cupredoxin [Lactarius quietus]